MDKFARPRLHLNAAFTSNIYTMFWCAFLEVIHVATSNLEAKSRYCWTHFSVCSNLNLLHQQWKKHFFFFPFHLAGCRRLIQFWPSLYQMVSKLTSIQIFRFSAGIPQCDKFIAQFTPRAPHVMIPSYRAAGGAVCVARISQRLKSPPPEVITVTGESSINSQSFFFFFASCFASCNHVML